MSLGKFDVLQKEILQMQFQFQQECIPVGCLPPAAVAVPGGLHQAPPLDQAPPGPGNPPGTRNTLGPGTPPGADSPGTRQKYNLAPTSLRAVINSKVSLRSRPYVDKNVKVVFSCHQACSKCLIKEKFV